MALSLCERETIINYSDAESEANIYTASPVVKKKLEKLGTVSECNGGWEISVPKSWIKISPPRVLKLTKEQRETRRKQAQNARKKCSN